MTEKQKENLINFESRTRKIKRHPKAAIKLLNTITLACIIVLSVFYVAVKNELTVKGFVINELQREFNRLDSRNNDLELDVMNLESYLNISTRADNMKMVKVNKVDYVNVNDSTMARR